MQRPAQNILSAAAALFIVVASVSAIVTVPAPTAHAATASSPVLA